MGRVVNRQALARTLPRIMFLSSLCFFAFVYGLVVYRLEVFPYGLLKNAEEGMKLLMLRFGDDKREFYQRTEHTQVIPTYQPDQVQEGLSLVTSLAEDNWLSVKVIDMQGEDIHEWLIDWFEIWPDATHVPAAKIPKSRPGTHIHGNELLDDGHLVFNFESLGLVRLDACGEVVWRLPYLTHHSIYRDEFDRLWVAGRVEHEARVAGLPSHRPPFTEPTVLELSLDGEILQEISVMDLLMDNQLQSLLYMTTRANTNTVVSGDTLHLNDVETFPSTLTPGFFQAGDLMISLRNVHAVLVFSRPDLQLKYLSIGDFVRQHDPDFLDGDTIALFDNNNVEDKSQEVYSRILVTSPPDDSWRVHYAGSETAPFFTEVMGKHQWLANGNVLITESKKGRAFEINSAGQVVWEYINLMDNEPGWVGIVEEVQRLPERFTGAFFEARQGQCAS